MIKDVGGVAEFYNQNQEFVISPFNPFGRISEFGKMVIELYGGQYKGRRVLDVGCGHGQLLRYLSDKGAETYGVDISSKAIKRARQMSPRSNFQVADALDLPFKDEEFDSVFCIETAEHFLDIEQGFGELYRVAKPGAVVIISTPNYFNTAGILKYSLERLRIYPPNTFAPFTDWKKQVNENFVHVNNIRKSLEGVGFEIVDQFTYNILHGILPFVSIRWSFYRWVPVRKLRHLVERFRYLKGLNKLGMNAITVARKPHAS